MPPFSNGTNSLDMQEITQRKSAPGAAIILQILLGSTSTPPFVYYIGHYQERLEGYDRENEKSYLW